MNISRNAMGGGALASKTLLASLAVLAVALVMLAAVPAVDADGSDQTYTPSGTEEEDSIFLFESGETKVYYANTAAAFDALSKALTNAAKAVELTVVEDKVTPAGTITIGIARSNITIDGDEKTFVGMTEPLVKFKGRSSTSLTITDLTIANSTIGSVYTSNTNAAGAFVAECFGTVAITNCHVSGSTIGEDGFNGTGGFIGYANADYGGKVSISGSSIENSTVYSEHGNAGGFIGLCTNELEMSECVIEDCRIIGGINDGGWWQSGAVAGLLNTSKTVALLDISIKDVSIAQGDYEYDFSGTMSEATFYYGIRISGFLTTIEGANIENDTYNNDGTLTPKYSTKPSFTEAALTVEGEFEIPDGAVLTVGEDGKIDVDETGTVGGSGKIVMKGTFSNKGSVTCLVEAEEGSKITNNGSMDSLVADEVYTKSIVEGDIIIDAVYGYEQRVVVTGNATVKGYLTVHGEIVIEKGATLTVESGAVVTIDGARTSVIEGALVLEGDETPAMLIIGGSAKVEVSGNLSVAGDLTIESKASIVFKEGASADIGGTLMAKKVVVEDSASLTISGAVENVSDELTAFEIAGTLIVSSDKVSHSFSIVLTADGALVQIEKVVLAGDFGTSTTDGDDGSADTLESFGYIEIKDLGVQIYNSKNDELDRQIDGSNNYVYLAGILTASIEGAGTYDAGAVIKDVTVSASVEETNIVVDDKDAKKTTKSAYNGEEYTSADKGKWEHAFTTTVSGSISVTDYFEPKSEPAASTDDIQAYAFIDILGSTSAEMGETVLGKNVYVVLVEKVDIVGTVTLVSGTSSLDEPYSNAPALYVLGEVDVKAPIAIGIGAEMYVFGELTVEAAIDATARSTGTDDVNAVFTVETTENSEASVVLKGEGAITVVDEITDKKDDLIGHLSGARYTASVSDNETIWYTTIDAALAAADNGDKDTIDLYGKQTVLTTATLVADDKLVMNKGAVLFIGDKDNADVVLTIAKDAKLKRGTENTITVAGTLYAEKKTDIDSLKSGILSEVYSEQKDDKDKAVPTGWAKWTNLNAALLEAVSGQTIELHSDADIAGTIPEGVTVKAGEFDLVVKQKTVLTVDGILDVTGTGKLYMEQAENKTSDDGKTILGIRTAAGAVVLNGQIRYADENSIVMGEAVEKNDDGSYGELTADAYSVAGAYFVIEVGKTDVNTISTPAYAASLLADVEGDVVLKSVKDARDNAIEKDEVGTIDLGAIMFAGKDADKTASIKVECSIAGVITIADATLEFADGVFVDATVSSATGTVAVCGVVSEKLLFTEAAFGEDIVDALFVEGGVKDKDSKTRTSVSFVGTVYTVEDLTVSTDSVTVEETLVVADGTFTSETDLDVDGTVVIGSMLVESGDANLVAEKELSVSGTLTIEDGQASAATLLVGGSIVIINGELTVSGDAEILGSVDATALNEEGTGYTAAFTVKGSLYIGIAAEDVYVASDDSDTAVPPQTVAGDASVAGNVYVKGFAVVAAGAVGPSVLKGEDVLNSTEYESTVFMVDGTEYITVYTVGVVSITGFTVEKENANFFADGSDATSGWYYIDRDGKEQRITSSSDKNVGAVKSVYAVFDTQIYAVKITADGGVSYITIDGKLMTTWKGYFYLDKLEAGTHVIAASAVSGYDISGIVLYVDGGDAVGSMSIDLSGKEYTQNDDMFYQASYQLVGSTVAAPSGGSSSGGDYSGIIDAIDKNTEAVKNQENGGGDSSLTDILLIVLVVLIVIMAILVAMRMMRS